MENIRKIILKREIKELQEHFRLHRDIHTMKEISKELTEKEKELETIFEQEMLDSKPTTRVDIAKRQLQRLESINAKHTMRMINTKDSLVYVKMLKQAIHNGEQIDKLRKEIGGW